MYERIKESRKAAGEGGFTLIELLVVIIILGILAAVVVFAVGGVGDKGQQASCKIDTRTLRTAQEAHFASPGPGGGTYGTEAELVTRGFLSEQSTYHNTTPDNGANPKTFTITIEDARCGTVGAPVNSASGNF